MPTARTAPPPTREDDYFDMHPRLLMDIIQRQAGTLSKAVLEGVMNSVDAGAATCEVTITPEKVTIADDGRGILEREEIQKFFKTFGQPHTEDEKKVYGAFRMGRGQMFAYGFNAWRTGPFQMDVDVKNKGLKYVLRAGLPVRKGCEIHIGLYTPLLPGEVAETERTLAKWVRYAPCAVLINGVKLNVDPAKEKWDVVTDDAYVRLSAHSSLTIYNLGVHTMDLGTYRMGTGGVVVSRRQLKVNFARNDIQSDCPVWRRLRPLIDQKAQSKLQRKAQLSDGERQRLGDLLAQGDAPPDAEHRPLFTTVAGRHVSARQIVDDAYKYRQRLTHCRQGNPVGDKVMQQKLALVLADSCLERFGTDLAGVLKLAVAAVNRGKPHQIRDDLYRIVPFGKASAGIGDSRELLEDKDLTAVERMWQDLASRTLHEVQRPGVRWVNRRRLVVGASDCADGWTDGETFVAVDRKFLRRLRFDASGITALGVLLLHEMTHAEPSSAEHIHSPEFYEEFHERCRDQLPDFVAACRRRLPDVVKALGKGVDKFLLREADQTEKVRRTLQKLLDEIQGGKYDPDDAEVA